MRKFVIAGGDAQEVIDFTQEALHGILTFAKKSVELAPLCGGGETGVAPLAAIACIARTVISAIRENEIRLQPIQKRHNLRDINVVQELAAKHEVHPDKVSTWKR